ncbi:hypothetical protein V8E36_002937 [Tilletia maclaganii]
MKIHKASVQDILKVYRTTGSKYALPRSGRPRKPFVRVARALRCFARANRRVSLDASGGRPPFRLQLPDDAYRPSQGYHLRIARDKPMLDRKGRLARLRWAATHKHKDWGKIVLTDERGVQVGQTVGRDSGLGHSPPQGGIRDQKFRAQDQ